MGLEERQRGGQEERQRWGQDERQRGGQEERQKGTRGETWRGTGWETEGDRRKDREGTRVETKRGTSVEDRQEERKTELLPYSEMNYDPPSPPLLLSHPSISQKLNCAAGAGVYLRASGEMPGKCGLPPPKSSGQWKTLPGGLAPSAAHGAPAG